MDLNHTGIMAHQQFKMVFEKISGEDLNSQCLDKGYSSRIQSLHNVQSHILDCGCPMLVLPRAVYHIVQ